MREVQPLKEQNPSRAKEELPINSARIQLPFQNQQTYYREMSYFRPDPEQLPTVNGFIGLDLSSIAEYPLRNAVLKCFCEALEAHLPNVYYLRIVNLSEEDLKLLKTKDYFNVISAGVQLPMNQRLPVNTYPNPSTFVHVQKVRIKQFKEITNSDLENANLTRADLLERFADKGSLAPIEFFHFSVITLVR